jgi:hypothetical protein
MSNQGDRQASVRASTGTTWTYEGDWHALFTQGGIAAGDFDGRMLAWINSQLGTSYTEINGAMHAYAVSQGVADWNSLGTFSLAGATFFIFLGRRLSFLLVFLQTFLSESDQTRSRNPFYKGHKTTYS